MRRGRTALGAVSGLLWGMGGAVLVQQFGALPLDPPLMYGLPAAAAVLSGAWGRRGDRARMGTAAAAVVLLAAVPALQLAQAVSSCTVSVDGQRLNGTRPSDPIDIDPEQTPVVWVILETRGGDGQQAAIWAEFGGFRFNEFSGVIRGERYEQPVVVDDVTTAFGSFPGLYHVGGTVGDCTGEGYVRVAGNPFTSPVGAGAAGATALGLLGTGLAGTSGSGPKRRSAKLQRTGATVDVAGVEVTSPGLDGDVRIVEATDPHLEATQRWTSDVHAVFDAHHMTTERVIEISNTAESADLVVPSTATTPSGEPALVLDIPHPGGAHGQLLVSTDESGVTRWHFPRRGHDLDTSQGGSRRRYLVPRRVAPRDEPEAARHAFQSFGSKLLSVVVFPLLDPVFGRVGEGFARAWEQRRRPYRVRTFTSGDYDRSDATEPDWDHLAGGKALLMVHGTFSQSHTSFGQLTSQFVDDLSEVYKGRVFAFDHPTLSEDPRANVEWLLAHLPDGLHLDLDIICHSRGGLVSRVLAEKRSELRTGTTSVAVDRVVFTATPNAGTILADPRYIGDFVDSYTNVLNFTPGPPLLDVFDAVVTVVKHAAVGASAALDGLQAMRPGGPFLSWLNTPSDSEARYFALAGDYTPVTSGWRLHAADRLMDQIFSEPNDLVVPTGSVYGANGSSLFPIMRRREFVGTDGIDHTGFFGDKVARDQLLEWLAGPRGAAVGR